MKNIPILILHGWNLTASKFWELQNEFKKKGYHVICPNLPGFGTSRIPNRPLILSDYVKFVENMLKLQKINKVILVGHSFGGRIGIKLAVERPQLVHSMVLVGVPGINPVPKEKILFFLYLAKIGNLVFNLPILAFLKSRARKYLYKAARASDFYNTHGVMRETFKNIVREDLSSYLKKIAIPILLLWGEEEKIVPLRIAKAMSKLLIDAKLVIIPEARHGLPWTHPKIFVSEIEKFLKSLD